MKAKPVKIKLGEGYISCPIKEATHITINIPGPTGILTLPFILKDSRKGTCCWTWNGDTESPTLKPSILTTSTFENFRCHSWINDGFVQFLSDCTHEYARKNLELLDVE